MIFISRRYYGKTIGYHTNLVHTCLVLDPTTTAFDINMLNFMMYKAKQVFKDKRTTTFITSPKEIYESIYSNDSRNKATKIKRIQNYFDGSKQVHQKNLAQYKLCSSFLSINTPNVTAGINLFESIYYHKNNHTIKVKVTQDGLKEFTHLNHDAVFYAFDTVIHLRGKYAKLLFMFLSAYKDTGMCVVNYESFINLIQVSKTYRKDPRHFKDRILIPTVKRIQLYFPNLTCTVYKDRYKDSLIKFTFSPVKLGFTRKKLSDKELINNKVYKHYYIEKPLKDLYQQSTKVKIDDNQLPF